MKNAKHRDLVEQRSHLHLHCDSIEHLHDGVVEWGRVVAIVGEEDTVRPDYLVVRKPVCGVCVCVVCVCVVCVVCVLCVCAVCVCVCVVCVCVWCA